MDFLLRDQLLSSCGHELWVFLKEKAFVKVHDMAVHADYFADARGGTKYVVPKEGKDNRARSESRNSGFDRRAKSPGDRYRGDDANRQRNTDRGKSPDRGRDLSRDRYRDSGRRVVTCFHCGGQGHISPDCPQRGRLHRAAALEEDEGAAYEEQKRVSFADSRDVEPDNAYYRGSYRGRQPRSRNRGRVSRSRGRGRGQYQFPPVDQGNSCIIEVPPGGVIDDVMTICAGKTTVTRPLESECTFSSTRLPVAEGLFNGQVVTVMRDTGCTGVVVRKSLVNPDQFLGRVAACMLVDKRRVNDIPVAMITIDTPFFKGETEALCMDETMYDLTIGNVDGSQLPVLSDFRGATSHAVETRAQVLKRDETYRKLRVPTAVAHVSRAEFQTQQDADVTLTPLRVKAKEGKVLQSKNGNLTTFQYRRGLLYRQFECAESKRKFRQLIVPQTLRQTVLKVAHESIMSGHLGVKKTTDRVLSEFFWPGVCGDVTRYCRSCDICQRTISKGHVTKVPIGRMPLIDTPFKRVAVDLVGPIFPATDRKNRYILTLVDYATRYPEAIPLPSIEAERVAEALVDMFSRLGIPEEILTDRGSQFTSEVMHEVSRLLSLRQLTTTPYHPMCNGLVERFNGTLKLMLKRMANERPKDWDKYINALLFAYREVPQESLGFSPFELLYGRTVRGPMSVLKDLWSEKELDDTVKSTYQYVLDLREKLEQTCEIARENLGKASKRYAKYYDRKARDRKYAVGEKVLVLLPTDNNKLLLQWKGPYSIVDVLNAWDYKIDMKGKLKTFHVNMLKRYELRLPPTVGKGILTVIHSAVIDDTGDGNSETGECSADEHMTCPTGALESIGGVELNPGLTKDQKCEVEQVLNEFKHVLTDKPGRTHVETHDLKLSTSEPLRIKGYPIPYNVRDTVRDEVEEMLKLGVIEPSRSPFSSPVILVKKKDGGLRFCIDFRQVNKVTVFDAEPMPDIEAMFSKLSHCKFFSKLDLSKGYWQVPLADHAKPFTAFEAPQGLFQFKVMPSEVVTCASYIV